MGPDHRGTNLDTSNGLDIVPARGVVAGYPCRTNSFLRVKCDPFCNGQLSRAFLEIYFPTLLVVIEFV